MGRTLPFEEKKITRNIIVYIIILLLYGQRVLVRDVIKKKRFSPPERHYDNLHTVTLYI